MSWRYVSRTELLEILEKPAIEKAGLQELHHWLRDVLVDSEVEIKDADASLIHSVVQRLEVASDATVRRLADDFARLIQRVPDVDVATQLIPLVEERERVEEMLQKFEEGQLSRTAFLSYLTERKWPRSLKERLAGMNSTSLDQLRQSLSRGAYEMLPSLLLMS